MSDYEDVDTPATMQKRLAVPKYPDQVILPRPPIPPPPMSHTTLRQVCDKLLNVEPFSVTKSPSVCPVGAGPNELYTVKPYWWNEGGQWVRKDGQKNPDSKLPQSQNQLHEAARAIQALAFGASCLPQAEAYTAKANQLLQAFFLDPATRMVPEVNYSQCIPGQGGDKAFAIALRYIILVDQALTVLQMPPEIADGMRQWLSTQAKWMAEGEQGKSARESANNITLWYHAIYASHLSVIDPGSVAAYVQQTLASEHKDPAKFFEPELQRTRRRHYTLFSLEALFVIAGAGGVPDAGVQQWLATLVAYAKTVTCGDIEVDIDADQRFNAKVAYFDRQLQRWGGQPVPECDPDGSGWIGGWNQRSKLVWQMV